MRPTYITEEQRAELGRYLYNFWYRRSHHSFAFMLRAPLRMAEKISSVPFPKREKNEGIIAFWLHKPLFLQDFIAQTMSEREYFVQKSVSLLDRKIFRI